MSGKAETSKVYVSALNFREEKHFAGRFTIVLRSPKRPIDILYDPEQREGWELPAPPSGNSSKPTRITEDARPDGTTIRHLQFLTDNRWVELSTTTCNADHVMVAQEFTLIDQEGHLVTGNLTQTDILVGPQSEALFEVPANVVIRRMPK